ncbi:hypothetical protein V5S96_09490 [Corynebacterium mastitidis]|uniref:Uncharacterized protein n=1 Tax=Corynebacterium mastitidis TaxID=161890 RepID=A0ABU8NZY4_9CORY
MERLEHHGDRGGGMFARLVAAEHADIAPGLLPPFIGERRAEALRFVSLHQPLGLHECGEVRPIPCRVRDGAPVSQEPDLEADVGNDEVEGTPFTAGVAAALGRLGKLVAEVVLVYDDKDALVVLPAGESLRMFDELERVEVFLLNREALRAPLFLTCAESTGAR